ncbi:MAG TPA: PAS domain S-box protein, partial [Chitinophagaceae bacterium]
MFLAAVHGVAFITISINYFALRYTGNYPRFSNIILLTGTIVVLSLFATGGWENTGFLWPFAYLPFVFFLSDGKSTSYWALGLFGGCVLLVVLHILEFIIIPYSAIALLNYFAALLVFLTCLYFFRKASRQVEDALRDSEARTQALFNAAPDAVVVIDQSGLVVQWNPRAETIFGWKSAETIGQLLSHTIIPHRYREAHQKGLANFLKTGTGPVLDKTIEMEALRKDNTELDVALSISPTRVNGSYFFIGFVREITAQKKAEEEIRHLNATLELRVIERTNELRISEEKYRNLFQNNPMPMWVIELPSFKFLSVNEAAIRHYGYSAEEFMSMTAVDIRPAEEIEGFVRLNRQENRGPYYTGQWKHRKKNGTIITVEINSDEIVYEGKNARLILSTDITEKVKNEESRALYASIINSTDDAILSKTLDGIITSWNRGAEVLYGYSRAEAIGRHVSMLLPSDKYNEETEILEKTKQGDFTDHYETERIRKDGKIIQVSLTVSPLRDSNGTVFGASTIGRNITDRKRAEQKIKELNETLEKKIIERTARLEASNLELEAFTYSVSHDLRAPLRIIDGYANILISESSHKLDEEGHRVLGIIMSNARRMGQLIDDLLNLSRLGRRELAMKTVDMNELLEPVIAELLSLNDNPPEINIARLEPADCDANLIRQVWGNLISNSIKYSRNNEKPVIEISSY